MSENPLPLFDTPTPEPAARERDYALEAASHRPFQTSVFADIISRPAGGEFTGEDVRISATKRGAVAGNPHAWGAAIMAAIKSGLMEPTGRYVRMHEKRSHGRKTAVYRRLP